MMLYYALIFLLVGLVASILGQTGIAAVAGQIAWILFLIGIVFLIIHLVRGRVPPGVSRVPAHIGSTGSVHFEV